MLLTPAVRRVRLADIGVDEKYECAGLIVFVNVGPRNEILLGYSYAYHSLRILGGRRADNERESIRTLLVN